MTLLVHAQNKMTTLKRSCDVSSLSLKQYVSYIITAHYLWLLLFVFDYYFLNEAFSDSILKIKSHVYF